LAGLYSWSFTTGTDIFSVSIDSPSSDKAIIEGDVVNFQASIIGGKSPFIYSWAISEMDINENGDHEDLGDFKFETAGVYTVTFTATDADKKTASASRIITVRKYAIPPIITNTVPDSDATNVSIDTIISAGCSEALNISTVNSDSFFVTTGDGYTTVVVDGKVNLDYEIAVFRPTESLIPNTTYTVTATSAIKSRSGMAIQKDYSWSFTTGSTSGYPQPTWIYPENGKSNVLVTTNISLGFTHWMDVLSITEKTFLVNDGSKNIAGSIVYDNGLAEFRPAAELTYNTTYTVTVTTGVKNRSGIAMKENHVWSFTTIGSEPPEVLSTTPTDGATKMPVNAPITAAFSKDMDESTLTSAFMVENDSHNPINGTVSYSNRVAMFIPAAALEYGKTYTAFVTDAAKDSIGIPLQTEKSWSFTTAAQGCGVKGDINGDNKVTLADAVLALQICSGAGDSSVCKEADINGDGKIGIAELIYILNFLATN